MAAARVEDEVDGEVEVVEEQERRLRLLQVLRHGLLAARQDERVGADQIAERDFAASYKLCILTQNTCCTVNLLLKEFYPKLVMRFTRKLRAFRH